MSKSALAPLAIGLLFALGCSSSDGGHFQDRENPAAGDPSTDGLYWTRRAYPTGDRRTSIVLIESGSPAEVSAGTRYEYVIRVTNLSDQNLDNVVVLDRPEGNFRLAGSTPRTENGRDLRWNLGRLPPKQAREITVFGTAIDGGRVAHSAELDWNSIDQSWSQAEKPRLAISQTATKSTLLCDPITYAVTVTNDGTGTARNIVVESRLPEGVTTEAGDASAPFTVASLERGQSKTFTWDARAAKTGRYQHSAVAKADGGLSAGTGVVWTTVVRPVLDLEHKGTEQAYIGRTVVYDMTLKNTGDGVARDVVVTDKLPEGTRFVHASGGGALDGGVVRWNLGNLEPGASKSFGLRLSSASAAKLQNVATASAYGADAIRTTVDTEVSGVATIMLEVRDLNDPIKVGGATTYLVSVTNEGDVADTNIRLAVELQDAMGFVDATGSTAADRAGRTIVFKPLATLEPGAKATWRIEVKATHEGEARIRVAMTSDRLSHAVEETETTTFFK